MNRYLKLSLSAPPFGFTEEAEGKGALSRGSKPFLSARSEAEHGYEAPPFQGARLGRGTSFVPASPPCSPLRAPLLLLTSRLRRETLPQRWFTASLREKNHPQIEQHLL